VDEACILIHRGRFDSIERRWPSHGSLARGECPTQVVGDDIVETTDRSGAAAADRGETVRKRTTRVRRSIAAADRELGRLASLDGLSRVSILHAEDIGGTLVGEIEGEEAIQVIHDGGSSPAVAGADRKRVLADVVVGHGVARISAPIEGCDVHCHQTSDEDREHDDEFHDRPPSEV
jgi:hypothetical protein